MNELERDFRMFMRGHLTEVASDLVDRSSDPVVVQAMVRLISAATVTDLEDVELAQEFVTEGVIGVEPATDALQAYGRLAGAHATLGLVSSEMDEARANFLSAISEAKRFDVLSDEVERYLFIYKEDGHGAAGDC